MSDTSPPPTTLSARILGGIINPKRVLDYPLLAIVSGLPSVYAWYIGAWGDVQVPVSVFGAPGASLLHPKVPVVDGMVTLNGYGSHTAFLALIVLVPLILFGVRTVMGRMAPIYKAWPPDRMPPLINLVPDHAKPAAYAAMRRALLGPLVLWGTVALTLLFQALDLRADVATLLYGGMTSDDLGFSYAFLRGGDIGKGGTVVMLVLAYIPQVLAAFLGFLTVAWLLAHNLFFLRRVYRRSAAGDQDAAAWFVLDLEDVDRCFGFRAANAAFNVQIVALVVTALILTSTRVSHVLKNPLPGGLAEMGLLDVIQDVGQFFVPFNWSVAFMVVALPSLVKLLPLLPGVGDADASRDLRGYLREFLPADQWNLDGDVPPAHIDDLAARFSANAFWPTGDNRAATLFYFAFLVFGFTVFMPVVVVAYHSGVLAFLVVLAVLLGGAWVAQFLLILAFNRVLAFVDPRLVKLPASGVPTGPPLAKRRPKIQAGVFLSYRRSDTRAYAGRLHDHLGEHFGDGQVFMDISSIGAGEQFSDVIETSLESVSTVLVLIGPEWVSVQNDDGSLRLYDQADFVRMEVAYALAADGVRVVPVLVDGASVPIRDQLPDELKALCDRNAIEISESRWAHDVQRLVEALRPPDS